MIGMVKRYICDSCKKQVCTDPEGELEGWITSEIGDLCPVCARSWDNYKESFLERMRKDNGKSLV